MAEENYGIALGMIETRGLVPAIEAADAMTKAAEVLNPSKHIPKCSCGTFCKTLCAFTTSKSILFCKCAIGV